MINLKRRGSCDCNGDFVLIASDIWYGGRSTSFEDSRFYHNCCDSINVIGETALNALNKSREVDSAESKVMFTNEKISARYKERMEYMLTTYNYKTENALYKNMMSCSISDDGEKIEISPMKKGNGIGNYERTKTDGIKDIYLSSDSPPEIIGAALKFAFTRCKGKGVEVVTKALFPGGVPNSLEEYLESVNKNYKNWLISC